MANEQTAKPAKGSSVVELGDDKPATTVAAQTEIEVKAISGKNHDDQLSGKKVSVTFYEQEGDLGKLPIQIGLNGYAYLIPRNVPVSIPEEVMGVINDAVETIFEAKGGGVTERKRPRFSFTVHGAAAG